MSWKHKLINPIVVGNTIYLKQGHTADLSSGLIDKKAIIKEIMDKEVHDCYIVVSVYADDGSILDDNYGIYGDEWYIK